MNNLNKNLKQKVKKQIPNNIIKILDKFVVGVRKILGKKMNKIMLYGSYARRRL